MVKLSEDNLINPANAKFMAFTACFVMGEKLTYGRCHILGK